MFSGRIQFIIICHVPAADYYLLTGSHPISWHFDWSVL